jgi:hypothetical protein
MEFAVVDQTDDFGGMKAQLKRMAASRFIYNDPDYFVAYCRFYGRSCRVLLVKEGNDVLMWFPVGMEPTPPGVSSILGSEYVDVTSSWYYGGPMVDTDRIPNHERLLCFFRENFFSYCRDQSVLTAFIRFDPNTKNCATWRNALPVEYNRPTVPVDLAPDLETILGNMDGSVKEMKKARNAGLHTEISDRIGDFRDFYGIYQEAMRRYNAPDRLWFSEAFFADLAATVAGNTYLVKLVDGHGRLRGGFWVIHSHQIGHYYLGASEREYWRYRCNDLLCFEAVRHARAIGLKRLDLQGGRPGVFEFKAKFSPLRGEFHVAKIVVNKDAYATLQKHYPTADGSFFPPYRQ